MIKPILRTQGTNSSLTSFPSTGRLISFNEKPKSSLPITEEYKSTYTYNSKGFKVINNKGNLLAIC